MAFGYNFDPENLNEATVRSVARDLANQQYADANELADAQSMIDALNKAADTRGGIFNPSFHATFNQAIAKLASKGSPNIQQTKDQQGQPQSTYTGQPTITTGTGGVGTGTSPVPSGLPITQPNIDTQIAEDKSLIEAEGQRQFGQTTEFINQDTLARESARQKLAEALTKTAQGSFQFALPQTLEDLNSRNLLNGSGLEQELGRQQAQIARDITGQVGALGAGDIDTQSQQRAAALMGQQGFQSSGLSRGFSLQDFQRQAQLSREIGAMAAPPSGGGKGDFGSVLSGVGAVAPYAGFAATGNPLWLGGAAAKPSSGGGK